MRDRLLRAGFWDSYEIFDAFEDGWGVLLYCGLWGIADDSGCLENDPRKIKHKLFPTKEIITNNVITGWLDKYIQLKKLLPYEGKGKALLFIVHFPDHQSPPNPTAPKLPLPAWLVPVPSDSNRRWGRYEVKPRVLAQALGTVCELPVDSLCTGTLTPTQPLPLHNPIPEGGVGETKPSALDIQLHDANTPWMMAARMVRDHCKPLSGATLKSVCRYLMEDWHGDKTPQEIIDQVSKLSRSGIDDRSSRDLFEPFEVVR